MKRQNWCKPEQRAEALIARRNLKMARSSHAFVRGATQKFYEWLESTQGLALPQGPAVWICGDCHSGNLGPISSAKGRIEIQIRDFDQSVIGNPVHDIIRLGLSLASSARGSDLPGVTTAKMMEQLIEGYRQAFDVNSPVAIDMRPRAIRSILHDALNRNWKHLARERLGTSASHLSLGKHFWPVTALERDEIKTLIDSDKVRRMVTALRSRDDNAEVEVEDAAFWVKGCSSLGRLRYAVLVRIGGKDGEACLIDIKEAAKAIAPRYPDTDMPRDQGERVVTGAWHMSPALGDRMVAGHIQNKPMFLRELLPQDLKLDINTLTQEEAMQMAAFLGNVVGNAHARQLVAADKLAWFKALAQGRSKTLDAPSWLWTSIVELMASHESAYLDHCRRYALTAAA